MNLEIEDLIRSSIETSNTDIKAELEETVEKLEKIYSFKYNHVPNGFHEHLEAMRKISREMEQLAKNKSYQKQIEVCKLLRTSMESFRLKYGDFLPNELPKKFEEAEESIKSIEADAAIKIFISNLANILEFKSEEFNRLNLLKNVCDFLYKFLENTEFYVAYIPNIILKSIEKMMMHLAEVEGHETDSEEEKETLNTAKIMAKAILWEINHKKSSLKKFDTIDELWEYWNNKYDQEEIERSLNIFKEEIDRERNNQGGRTLFS